MNRKEAKARERGGFYSTCTWFRGEDGGEAIDAVVVDKEETETRKDNKMRERIKESHSRHIVCYFSE